MKRTNPKVMLISSSTGGHAIPVYELLISLAKFKLDLIVVHSNSEIEKELFRKTKSYLLRSGKTKYGGLRTKLFESIKLFWSSLKSGYILLKERPDLVFSKGGFNSVPVLFWANILKIPYFIHESDSVMGKANRIFADRAEKTFVSFPLEYYKKDLEKMIYSGLIVRDFKLDNNIEKKNTILITGGSLGAKSLSSVVSELLPDLLSKYRIIYSSGTGSHSLNTEGLSERLLSNLEIFSFSYEKMEKEMLNADLIISRAGANVLGEISKLKKASILIPYPYASEDHQTVNAKHLERLGGVIMLKQEMLTADRIRERIEYLMSDKRNLKVLGENANKALKTDGKELIVKEILDFLGVK